MSGLHGFASAAGARAAGLSAPARRALVLVGLLTGVLTAAWILGASSAEAEEIPLVGDTELVTDTELTDTGLVTEAVERTQPVVEAEPEADAVDTPAPEDAPLDATLTDVGQKSTETVRDVSETVVPQVSVQGTDVVGPVHDTLDGVAAELDGRLDETVAATGLTTQNEDGAAAGQHEEHGARESREPGTASEPESDEPVRTHEGPHVAADLPEPGDAASEAAATDGGASEAVPATHHHSALTSAATASAHGGAAPGAAVTGFLPVTGGPAPEPGPNQAARHVLHAVPTADADEPTFAPD